MDSVLTSVHGALNDFLLVFADALVLMLIWLGKHWAEQIGFKVQNDRSRAILQRAETLAVAVVKRVFQAYVKPAKDSGRWGPEQQRQAHDMAVTELKDHLGFRGMQELGWVMFGQGTPPEDVRDTGIISTLIEAAIHDNKQLGRAVQASAPPPPARGPALAFPPRPADSTKPFGDVLFGATGPLDPGPTSGQGSPPPLPALLLVKEPPQSLAQSITPVPLPMA